MSKSHNKKRNTALIYEFIIKKISKAIVEGDNKTSSMLLKLIRKHFKVGTALHEEFKLINSLRKITITNTTIASNIINEAKIVSKKIDNIELSNQKSLLISEINKFVNDDNFYDQQVNDYKLLATIQTLVNDWRMDKTVLNERTAIYEQNLLEHIMSDKSVSENEQIIEESHSPGEARLLMKIMAKKINEKYSSSLNEQQKSIVKSVVYSAASDDISSTQLKLDEVKSQLQNNIDVRINENILSDEKQKLLSIKDKLLSENTSVINDEVIKRFMQYAKLNEVLLMPENHNQNGDLNNV